MFQLDSANLFGGFLKGNGSSCLSRKVDDSLRSLGHRIGHLLLSLTRRRWLLTEEAHLVNRNRATRSQGTNIVTGSHLRRCDRIKTAICHSLELVGQSSAGIWQCSFNHPRPSGLASLAISGSGTWGCYPTIKGACRHTALSACRLHTTATRLHHCERRRHLLSGPGSFVPSHLNARSYFRPPKSMACLCHCPPASFFICHKSANDDPSRNRPRCR